MVEHLDTSVDVSERTATALLVLFLVAVLAALAVTLYSVAAPVQRVAASVVSPIIALGLVVLYFERRRRAWSFMGAAALGVLGVALRLVVSSRPELEVGGGLPLWVTVTYVALGSSMAATSLWAFRYLRRADRPE
jgi:hypothetical protein